ncbi:MAG: hypothetical protein H7A49_06585 [Akkermansiaceae bacterium]|nr:hypothetical protein [Akkermansiaceae bacterium]
MDWKAAQALTAKDERVAALIKVFQEAMEPAPDIAEAVLREIPVDAEQRFSLVQQWVRHLVAEDRIKEAREWAESIYSEDQRRMIRSEIAALLMDAKPEEAIQMLSVEELEAGGADSASGTVLQMWTSKEPRKAVTWASRLPDGQARQAGFQSVFSAWAGTNGQEALSWIGTQTNPHVRQDALDGAARAFQHHPEPIFDSIFSEADPELKQQLQQRISDLNAPDPAAPPPAEELEEE